MPSKDHAPPAAESRDQATESQRTGRRARSPAKDATPTYGIGPVIDGQEALDRGLAALRAIDPLVIDPLIAAGAHPPLRLREPGFVGLAFIIVSQQVSTTSAQAIFRRLQSAIVPLEAPQLLAASDEDLRNVGLSGAKIRALRAAAEAVASGRLPLATLGCMPAEEAHRALVAVKGIGPWSANIFLLFCLGHPDAWPAGDIALQEAAKVALTLETRPTTAELDRIGDRWRPHRGVAARVLWAYYRIIKEGRDGMSLAPL
ncbi:DNA-3-methyladenine glycosylase family protein [Lichenihabitans psoromatis]|uniref:DNA-3-methyladenine glycosylase family protein n=1 Tax=Lichenihabitans psoromatis TaxID=2528642 RepID=UPI00103562E4|nr:DNA-3-methyladenine glycosylase [Lichenihabitans psoromatis]